MNELTPQEIVRELDKYIVGQERAKRCVAIALRNRYRRAKLPKELQDEITPKNILMVGPTGVGKTEIARRLAKLVNAPFVKVEATKFTEVGYVGRDVDSMVRDLVENAISLVKSEYMEKMKERAKALVEDRILEILIPEPHARKAGFKNPFEALFGAPSQEPEQTYQTTDDYIRTQREILREKLRSGELEDKVIEVEVEDTVKPPFEMIMGTISDEMGISFQDVFGSLFPKKKKKKKMTIREAREVLEQEEYNKLIDMDEVIKEAIHRAEQHGIIFIDEIDKIAGRGSGVGPDVSREGVQRDILPIVEGSTVMTKYGPVKTDHILFIAAGAFHVAKVSDLIPELQGRFPVVVELHPLTEEDFKKILTQPKNAITKQYIELMKTEGVNITFTDDAIEAIAKVAVKINEQSENIGARRLHTVVEKIMEDISFEYANVEKPIDVVIDKDYVYSKVSDMIKDKDLNRFII
ncbi:heat shock protein HslVU, ATPase subunit HslU [Caldicellulosiruptor saccharolyticus DSM 8903]|uniref:ATP-dependent protease ATPase subunit HslU n=1 Tax=Caldicellulosiruptor saccharolyticus (strain ATCC 43494 / DSM 8903 / Tp8T 6331) TaxID=351627 RepID=HSLU_CALS8|nr:ATP-dependent protease ATPase subunit HslU [Caldicellulosiruptor saccharolyticus]A4XIX0.1 RecName: Full=ATP-dependent protease ATPase subunit HslU; AltName: Full=Unfoldase HslU [Caldicellulosiruptor saccharolyticus DSM 8903]ABP66855.1 heat shock protein HslVU, ATPase subunit HslU [Caldicellulosiruptor saccharolyticus DSM 8903]